LPACVAVFVTRNGVSRSRSGKRDHPLFGRAVPILSIGSRPGKGSGAVMCCTFGDTPM
jgi:hypothetical protein